MSSYYMYDRSGRRLRLLTAPTVEPITLGTAKTHLRLESGFTADDAYVTSLITTARQWTEAFTRRALMQQSWRLTLDRFPALSGDADDSPLFFWWRKGVIELAKPPVVSVDTLSYVAVDGTTQTMTSGTDFKTDFEDAEARIEPVWSSFWPFSRFEIASVAISFTCGYATGGNNISGDTGNLVPGPIKQAILLLIGHFYENREEVSAMQTHSLPMGAKALLWPYRAKRMN